RVVGESRSEHRRSEQRDPGGGTDGRSADHPGPGTDRDHGGDFRAARAVRGLQRVASHGAARVVADFATRSEDVHTYQQPVFPLRRVWAAVVDAAVVAVCCLILYQAFRPFSHGLPPWLWGPAAGVLALEAVVELLTGVTPGKWLLGLAVRSADG